MPVRSAAKDRTKRQKEQDKKKKNACHGKIEGGIPAHKLAAHECKREEG